MKYRSAIHHRAKLPNGSLRYKQRGVSIVAAIFLITGLAVLGAFLLRLSSTGSAVTINEWYSAQALYSAESGVDWAAYNIIHGGSGAGTDSTVLTDRSWFTTTVSSTTIGTRTIYTISSQGSAGIDVANPLTERQLEVQFLP